MRGFSMSVSRKEYDELVSGQLREEAGNHFTYAARCVIGFVEQCYR